MLRPLNGILRLHIIIHVCTYVPSDHNRCALHLLMRVFTCPMADAHISSQTAYSFSLCAPGGAWRKVVAESNKTDGTGFQCRARVMQPAEVEGICADVPRKRRTVAAHKLI